MGGVVSTIGTIATGLIGGLIGGGSRPPPPPAPPPLPPPPKTDLVDKQAAKVNEATKAAEQAAAEEKRRTEERLRTQRADAQKLRAGRSLLMFDGPEGVKDRLGG